MPRLSEIRFSLWLTGFVWFLVPVAVSAEEAIQLAEGFPDDRTYLVEIQVATKGQVRTSKVGGESHELDLDSAAEFGFRCRRLPPAGRDARALRSVRAFSQARVETDIGSHKTEIRLPQEARLIVANGDREGIVSYSPEVALTREAVDLLEMPGDPLVLLALLPQQAVRIGDEWSPSDWAAQLLTGIEALESSKLTCRLDEGNRAGVRIGFTGQVKGQRFGANTTIDVAGAFIFDRRSDHISQARTVYRIKSDIGTVNPGMEVTVTSNLSRKPADDSGRLTDDLLESIPLDPPDEALKLVFDAGPWGITLRHGREWHLFQSVFEGRNRVAILRLVEQGSLVCQCNLSPLEPFRSEGPVERSEPATNPERNSPDRHIPLEQFEADIKQSLGKRFKEILARERIPTQDGRRVFRVVVEGEVELSGDKGAARIPMQWIYYLVSDPKGRQASFVFSVEPNLIEQLAGRDQDIVLSLRFVAD